MLHENDKIKVHMIAWPQCKEIKTRNYREVFTIQKHPRTGKLCIDWLRGADPLAHLGNPLTPLDSFAWTVVFENTKNGKLYHSNAVAGGVVELAPEHDDLRRACAAGIA
jgi:hypothetical protein